MTSWAVLQQRCGFSDADFHHFRAVIMEEMRKPKNSVGSMGPGPNHLANSQHRRAWEYWLDLFIDDGIGDKFWGPGTYRKWTFATEIVEIRMFVREVVQYALKNAKKQELAKKRRLDSMAKGNREYKPRAVKEMAEVKPRTGPIIIDISSPEPQESDDFILEISLSGSNEFKLIYGNDVPTLEHLVESIGKRHGLNQMQEIVGVKVKIGERVCHVNLDEPRDWRYISGLVIGSGGRAQVVAEVS